MGGLVGAALVYANYYHAIDIFEGGRGVRTLATAGLFSTYAVSAHCQTIFTVSTNEILPVGLYAEHFVFLFGGKARPVLMSIHFRSCWRCSQALATAVLLIIVLAISDKRNGAPPSGLAPMALFVVILGLGASLGMETSEICWSHFLSCYQTT